MIDGPKPKRGFAIRLGKRLRKPVDRLIARSSRVPTTPFIDPALFPWSAALEAGWSDMRAELDALGARGGKILPLATVSPDHARVARDGKWKSFVFEAYGYHVAGNRALCPRTAALLDEVPGLVLAMFSIMEPGTHVPLHKGVSKALINGHLGLDVPKGDCRIEEVNGAPNDGATAVGQCQANSSRFGCYTTVEGGRAEATICVD